MDLARGDHHRRRRADRAVAGARGRTPACSRPCPGAAGRAGDNNADPGQRTRVSGAMDLVVILVVIAAVVLFLSAPLRRMAVPAPGGAELELGELEAAREA